MRKVLYDGPPANGVNGRRQTNDIITTLLPNGRSRIETVVTSGTGETVGVSTTNVIVEGMHAVPNSGD